MIDFRKDLWNHYLLPVGTHGLTISVKKDKVIDTDIVIKDNEQGAHAQPFPTWKNGRQLWWQHHTIKKHYDGQGGPTGSSSTTTDGQSGPTGSSTDNVVVTTYTENVVDKTDEVKSDVKSDVKDGVTSDNPNMD